MTDPRKPPCLVVSVREPELDEHGVINSHVKLVEITEIPALMRKAWELFDPNDERFATAPPIGGFLVPLDVQLATIEKEQPDYARLCMQLRMMFGLEKSAIGIMVERVQITRQGAEDDPMAKVSLDIQLRDGRCFRIASELLGSNFSHSVNVALKSSTAIHPGWTRIPFCGSDANPEERWIKCRVEDDPFDVTQKRITLTGVSATVTDPRFAQRIFSVRPRFVRTGEGIDDGEVLVRIFNYADKTLAAIPNDEQSLTEL